MSEARERPNEREAQYITLQNELNQIRQAHQATLRELEQRQILQAHYQQSQVRFRTIFEQSMLSKKILNSDLMIRQVNPALVSLLGFQHKKQLIGTHILDYAHPDYLHHWEHLQNQLWKEQIPNFSLETCLVKRDGSPIFVNAHSILFEDEGKLLGYTILEDITGRKLLEQTADRLYEAQELMIYTVSHDLKNPLLVIDQLNQRIRKEFATESAPPRLRAHLHHMEIACENAQAIVMDLLLIGELEGEPLLKEWVEVNELLRRTVMMAQVSAEQKGLVLELAFPSTPLNAWLNPSKIERALSNLLSNAIKFSFPGGKIQFGWQSNAEGIQFWIQDEGIGIPTSLYPSLFDKFAKGHRKGTQGEATTGLGLFIVKRIIDLHQGEIWLESQEGKGTTFYIQLPIKATLSNV